ncbi:S-adenosyl-L-methionine-dependent methyltransferase [Hyaloraphidium curvatum]|nr:S-adenosyl-L-methionine-dependent methyltransferase [Hyaloraphidium curvatum]
MPQIDTFFKDHWVTIEQDRLKTYDKLFDLPPAAMKTLIAPLDLQPGETALDFGCGPGFVAAAMAGAVGAGGKVHGTDVNADFCARARQVADERGVGKVVQIHHVTDGVGVPDGTVDGILAKNVLEYVPDLDQTLTNLFRAAKPGGRLLALDSDWAFVVVQPWTPDEVREVFGAAAPAFKEPFVGRKLLGAFRKAGFADVKVELRATADTSGTMRNMLNYGTKFKTLTEARAAELAAKVDQGLKDGTYMMVLPQFVVLGQKPAGKAAL